MSYRNLVLFLKSLLNLDNVMLFINFLLKENIFIFYFIQKKF